MKMVTLHVVFTHLYIGLFMLCVEVHVKGENIIRYEAHLDVKKSPGRSKCYQMTPRPLRILPEPLDFRLDICRSPTTENTGLDQTCLMSLPDCYYEVDLEEEISYRGYSLSICFTFECLNGNTMHVFQWEDVAAEISCDGKNEHFLRLFTSKSTNNLELNSENVLIILKYANTSDDLSEVIVNSKSLKVRSLKQHYTPSGKLGLGHVLRFGSHGLAQGSFHGVFKAAHLYPSTLDEGHTVMEHQYAQLLFRNASHPECLCLDGLSSASADTCLDGSSRLGTLPTSNVSLITINDGVLDSAQGFWEPPSKYVRLHLKLSEDSVVKGITLYLGRTIPGIEVQRCVSGCDYRLSMFCYNRTSCEERDENVSLAISRHIDGKKLEWKSMHHTLVRKLEFVFVNRNRADHRVYEIVLHGRKLDPPFSARQCLCFPGNGQKDDHCRDCGQCICRSGNTTKMVLAGKQCKPYLTSVHPRYGPISEGTRLTLHGGLLIPLVKQDIKETKVTIGNKSCNNINKNDENITCETPNVKKNDLPSRQRVKVEILVGGIFYNIKSRLYFHYRPDPVIEDIHPYKSFLGGGHNITILGRNFNSIFISPDDDILLVKLVTDDQVVHTKKGVCTAENDEKMVCEVPNITIYAKAVQANIGLLLDGLRKYRDLSSILKNKDHFQLCTKPTFEQKVKKNLTRGEQKYLSLKGKDINVCCGKADYQVTIGRDDCTVVDLEPNSLSCILTMDHGNRNMIFPIKVECLGLSFNIGFVEYFGSTTSYSVLYGVVGGVATILLIVLIAGTVICVSKRRKAGPADIGGSMAMLELHSTGQIEGGTKFLDKLVGDFKNIIEDMLIDCQNIQINQEIGQGNYGMVYKGFFYDDEEEIVVALKTLKGNAIRNKRKLEEFIEEATIMKGFEHTNVLTLFGIAMDAKSLFVVLPYMTNGDLRCFVTNKEVQLTNYTGYMLDVARGMEYLSSKKFVHRDLAARNCMVDGLENVLVGDFGLARDIYQKDYYRPEKRKGALPYRWMAIESMEQGIYTSETDVWSFGVTMWEVLSAGIKPYTHVDNSYIQKYICQGNRLLQPPACPNYMYSLMTDCWLEEPLHRPTFSDLVSEFERFLQLGVENVMKIPTQSCSTAMSPSSDRSFISSWSSSEDDPVPKFTPALPKDSRNECVTVPNTVHTVSITQDKSGTDPNKYVKQGPSKSPKREEVAFSELKNVWSHGSTESTERSLRPAQRRSEWGSSNVGPDSLHLGRNVKKGVDETVGDMGMNVLMQGIEPCQTLTKSQSRIDVEDYLEPVKTIVSPVQKVQKMT